MSDGRGYILTKRTGTKDNPFRPMEHPITVAQGKATLYEIPLEFNGVTITDGTTTLATTKTGLPDASTVVVDYNVGELYFDPIHEGKQFTATYVGTGFFQLSAKRVFTETTNPDAVSTLQDMVDNYNNLNGVDLYTKFDPNAGHLHSGAAGDGAKIPAKNIPVADSGNIGAANVEDALVNHAGKLDGHTSQLADIAINISNFPIQVPEVDDTARINRAITQAYNNGGGEVLLRNELYNISSPILLKNSVKLRGGNTDINVYNYNLGFEGVFPTEIKLADGSNCDMVVFSDRTLLAMIDGIFLNGNRVNQTSGRGVYVEALNSSYRGRNKIKNVMVYNTKDDGIYVSDYAYETEIHSSMSFYCGKGLYLGAQDCVLEEYSAGYNYGDGIEIVYGGAVRSHNIDSFGNLGDGVIIHDVMTLSFLKWTINGNKKNNLRIFQTATTGYSPSKLFFVNCFIFDCGENFSEIIFDGVGGTYAPVGVSFINSYIGSLNRITQGRYLVENTFPTKREINFVGCTFYTANYIDIFDISNIYNVVGCMKGDGTPIESYNRTLKQKDGIDLETVGYDYKSSSATLNPVRRFTSVNANGAPVTITLPLANKLKAGQEMIIAKLDASANTITIQASAGDNIKTGAVTSLTTAGQTARFITDGVTAWFYVGG